MTHTKTRELIEKLQRLTEARGATKAEAALAAEKVKRLQATLPKARPSHPGVKAYTVYVDGWPGQPKCEHQPDRANYYRTKGKMVCRKCGCEYLPDVHVWRKL